MRRRKRTADAAYETASRPLATYSRTQAQLVADLTKAVRQAEDGVPPLDWAATMLRLADPVRFPALSQAIAAGVFADDGGDPGDFPAGEFDFGLQRVLDGLDALDRSRRTGAPPAAAAPPARE